MKEEYSSSKHFATSGNFEEISYGQKLLKEGKVGCIILAGGDGTRLGHQGPKGTFPISIIKKKTLLQLFCERALAASQFFGKELPITIMTSPENHKQTLEHVARASFFTQNTLPLLDNNHQPLALEKPNGNGEVLHCFYESGLYDAWKNQGIEWVNVILVDNPLADPFDPNLCGHAALKNADVVLKTIKRKNGEEKLGSIREKEGRIAVIEYTESRRVSPLGNTSLFCFSMNFIKNVQKESLPIHLVQKIYDGKQVIKQEKYIFDLLDYAQSAYVLIYPREETFAPLKEKKDVGNVQKALLERDRKAFNQVSGCLASNKIFELHANFYYPTHALRKKWKGKLPNDQEYIEP